MSLHSSLPCALASLSLLRLPTVLPTGSQISTKWLKACHHSAFSLGAQFLLLRICLSVVFCPLHFQQTRMRTTWERGREVQSNPKQARSKFSFTFFIRKFHYGCFFTIQVFPQALHLKRLWSSSRSNIFSIAGGPLL